MAPEFELVNIFVRNTAFCFLKDSKERQMTAEPWGGWQCLIYVQELQLLVGNKPTRVLCGVCSSN